MLSLCCRKERKRKHCNNTSIPPTGNSSTSSETRVKKQNPMSYMKKTMACVYYYHGPSKTLSYFIPVKFISDLSHSISKQLYHVSSSSSWSQVPDPESIAKRRELQPGIIIRPHRRLFRNVDLSICRHVLCKPPYLIME